MRKSVAPVCLWTDLFRAVEFVFMDCVELNELFVSKEERQSGCMPAKKPAGSSALGAARSRKRSGQQKARAWLRVLKWLLLGFCIVWLYRKVDWSATATALLALPAIPFLAVLAQRFTPWLCIGLRFNVITEYQAGSVRCTASEILCLAFNSLLPARLGELVKILYLSAFSKLRVSDLLGKVFFERLMDVTALFAIVFIAAAFFLDSSAVIAMAAGLVFLWAVFAALLLSGRLKFAGHALQRLMKFAAVLRNSVKPLLHVRTLGLILLWTGFIWAMNLTHLYLVCNLLFHFELGAGGIGLMCAAVFMSSAFSAAPGGIGVMESAVVFVLSSLGKDAAQAAAAALVIRFLYVVPPMALSLAVITASSGGAAFLKDLRPKILGLLNEVRS